MAAYNDAYNNANLYIMLTAELFRPIHLDSSDTLIA